MFARTYGATAAILASAAICGFAMEAEPQAVRVRFSLAQSGDESPLTVTVSGKITDARSGQPIAGSLVRGCIVSGWKCQGPDGMTTMPYQQTESDGRGAYMLRFVATLSVSGLEAGSDQLFVAAGAKTLRPGRSGSDRVSRLTRPFSPVWISLSSPASSCAAGSWTKRANPSRGRVFSSGTGGAEPRTMRTPRASRRRMQVGISRCDAAPT